MVIDSSVLLSILLRENDSDELMSSLLGARRRVIAAPTYLESCIASTFRAGVRSNDQIRKLVRSTKIDIIDFPTEAAHVAVEAFLKYGKGQGHKAQLNFGDCISYAMSKTEMMPLLFKGEDFTLTDVDCAI